MNVKSTQGEGDGLGGGKKNIFFSSPSPQRYKPRRPPPRYKMVAHTGEFSILTILQK